MSWLDWLTEQPAPIDGRVVQRVTPLGDWGFESDEERKVARAEACKRYRDKNREAVNRRVREWKKRKKAAAKS
jgi:hypothetical protein